MDEGNVSLKSMCGHTVYTHLCGGNNGRGAHESVKRVPGNHARDNMPAHGFPDLPLALNCSHILAHGAGKIPHPCPRRVINIKGMNRRPLRVVPALPIL